MPTPEDIRKDAELVVDVCMSVEDDDVVTIICDNDHRQQADALASVALDRGAWPVIMDNEAPTPTFRWSRLATCMRR